MKWSIEDRARLVIRIAQGELSVTDVESYEHLDSATVNHWVGSFLHAAPECFDETMMGRLARQGLASEEPATRLCGRLEEVQPLDLLQSLGMYRKPGHVLFFHAHGTSQLWFEEGEIIDARSGGLKGAAAVYRIVGHHAGDFRVDVTGTPRPHAMEISGTALLLEAARRLDEVRRLAVSLPAASVVLGCAPIDAISPSASEDAGYVAASFGHGSTVGEVLQRSSLGELEALRIVAALYRDGQLVPTGALRRAQLPSVQRRAQALRKAALEMSQQVVAPVLGEAIEAVPAHGRSWAKWVVVGLVTAAVTGSAGFAVRKSEAPAAIATSLSGVSAPEEAPLVVGAPAVVGSSAGPATPCSAEMVLMPTADLKVGRAAAAGIPGATPAHRVSISAFCIDRHEVTMADYRTCSDAGDCKRAYLDAEWSTGRGQSRSRAKAQQEAASLLCNERRDGVDDHPVNCVTWDQADAYCRTQGKALPTEAQWERAARGRSDRRHPWGDAAPRATLVNACGPRVRWP